VLFQQQHISKDIFHVIFYIKFGSPNSVTDFPYMFNYTHIIAEGDYLISSIITRMNKDDVLPASRAQSYKANIVNWVCYCVVLCSSEIADKRSSFSEPIMTFIQGEK